MPPSLARLLAFCLAFAAFAASAAEPPHHHRHGIRPDENAPIGVTGAHMHPAGGFMFSYRYDRMRMDGNRDDTTRVKESQILLPTGSYRVAPSDMDMQMHVFGFMYAPADWVTLSAMIPWVELEMDHITATGERFTTKSDGVGDLKLSGLLRLFEDATNHVHLNAGLSFPTGGLGHKDEIPIPNVGFRTRRLPYPMQIGSGSWDILPGLTYIGAIDWLSWGAQVMGTVRLGENRHDYRLGHRADTTAWAAIPLWDWISLSARIRYRYNDNITGADDSLDPNAIPTADPDLRRGHFVDLLAGVNFVVPLGLAGDHSLAFEGGAPIYQNLDGPQLETDWRITVGWQLTF